MTKDARGYSDADLAEVRDFPELTDDELARAKPFATAFPEMAAAMKKTRGAQKAPTKTSVTLRVDPAVVEKFKAEGPGWQTRMNAALAAAVGLSS